MDIDKIAKLLRSTSNEDRLIGFEFLRQRCFGNSFEMNKLLYETNIRIHRYSKIYYIHITTARGGKSVIKIK